MSKESIPRGEYPRPDAKRDNWICLNGMWDFEFDPKNEGLKDKWYLGSDLGNEILVPFVFQSRASGIDSQALVETVWYARELELEVESKASREILLNFGGVDYETDVFIDGIHACHHEGGCTPFTVPLSGFLDGNGREMHRLVLRVKDPPFSGDIPRGKQTTEMKMSGARYERCTGIWQSVWLEQVNDAYLDRETALIRANPWTGDVTASIRPAGKHNANLVIEATVRDEKMQQVSETSFMFVNASLGGILSQGRLEMHVDPGAVLPWSPSNPTMYSVVFRLIDGDSDDESVLDELTCSFGFRTIEVKGNQVLLNHEPLYLKQVLYQGYWPDGLWTAPSDEAILQDLQLAATMGFNCLRLHQKVEDPRLLFHADRMGMLLWGEMANSWSNSYNSHKNLLTEWLDVVCRDRNHPSIITWVPYNESWGTGDLSLPENQEWLKSVYRATKYLDPTRPVVDNDGWEHVLTDICTIHDYSPPNEFASHYPVEKPSDMSTFLSNLHLNCHLFAPGCMSRSEPIMITEWGGWAQNLDDPNAKSDRFACWGYQGIIYKDFNEILDMYGETIDALIKRKSWIAGHCYTEFCDYFQEMNGLLTFDRRPKGDLRKLKKINDRL